MKWTSSKDGLPEHKEEVLIRAGGLYHLASFDKDEKCFHLRTGEKVKTGQIIVQWTRLVKP